MVGWHRGLRSVFGLIRSEVKRNGAPYSTSLSQGQTAHLWRTSDISSPRYPGPFYQYVQREGFFSSRILLAKNDVEPVSSPLIPFSGDSRDSSEPEKRPVCVREQVQAVKKDIRMLSVKSIMFKFRYLHALCASTRQSPKKLNLVAELVRGMRVEDALLQLQVLVKRASKTVYQVIHSARANATHNHGMDGDKLLVAEAFVGKGMNLKRVSYHSKGRSGIMIRPKCRLTVVVRELTAEEDAKIARLKVSNFRKLSKRERQLVPHRLIESTPRWNRKPESSPN